MNGTLLLIASSACFAVAYCTYGRYLKRLFGVDPDRKTPAHTRRDGVDYVPTRMPVLFGHHFASIAGAGPIVGPIAAAYFGWVPVVIWILIGCIFIGAMHDMAALFLSVRDEGRSIGHVIERQIGYVGRQLFLLFCWAALILVVAVFASIVAKTFVGKPEAATASLLFIGMAPLFGWLVYKKNVPILVASLIFVPLLFLFVWVGVKAPLHLESLLKVDGARAMQIWALVLFAYVFVASVIPVWLLLQPRDYLNSFLLYTMILLGFAGVIAVSPSLQFPAFAGFNAANAKGLMQPMFPILFVTVACGACSGFHALVASGTSAKQIGSERDILPIGYGAMLVEGVLAVMALISVAYLSREDALAISANPVGAFAGGLSGFCSKLGLPEKSGGTFFVLAVSAFLLTTLDTATRLARFTWQELCLPREGSEGKVSAFRALIGNRYVATILVIVVAGYLTLASYQTPAGEVIPAWKVIWPVFGASNQLLAALTLLVVTLVLARRKANFWVALVPMVMMLAVSGWALIELLKQNLAKHSVAMVIATGFLLVMAAVLAVQGVLSLRTARRETTS